jgi:hypothetical protein
MQQLQRFGESTKSLTSADIYKPLNGPLFTIKDVHKLLTTPNLLSLLNTYHLSQSHKRPSSYNQTFHFCVQDVNGYARQ